MPSVARNKEAHRPSVAESAQSLIDRKKSEREAKVSADVSRKMAGTQEGVADVLAGVEKPSEYISERAGERGNQGQLKTGKGSVTQAAKQVLQGIQQYVFPDEEKMVIKIRNAIEAQIDLEMKKAKHFEKRLATGGAADYNASIARIRKLKDILASLVESTVTYLKDLYVKYFDPDGKRKNLEEV